MENNNEQLILNHLMGIREDIGTIKSNVQSMNTNFVQHLEDDKVTANAVSEIQATLNKQRGVTKTLAILWAGLLAVCGIVYSKH